MTIERDLQAYVDGVLSGDITAGKLIIDSVQRYVFDVETCQDRGFYFDINAVQRVVTFFRYLHHYKGKWKGQPFILSDWQLFIVANIFGWRKVEDGTRRFRYVYIEVGRKNGKTTFVAGIGLFLLTKDGENAAEVYTAATKRDQARILWDDANAMVSQSKALREHIKQFAHSLNVPSTHSKMLALSADAQSMDGLNVHAGLVDELHAHPNDKVWSILDTATSARQQPLMIAITTAGVSRHSFCYKLREYASKVSRRVLDDDSFFAVIHTCDKGDDWKEEATWRKANPNFGVSINAQDLAAKAAKAAAMPSELTNFLIKHLCVWVSAANKWLIPDKWIACYEDYTEESLQGGVCFGGLDLSSRSDLSSFTLVFSSDDRQEFKTIGRYYLPEAAVLERVERAGIPYDQWVREGFITVTPGDTIDYRFIKHDILELCAKYTVLDIAFDPWNSSQLITELQEEGVVMVAFRQGFASMSPAMKELERLVLSRSFKHNDNPVLNWAIDNVSVTQDPAGNIKPDKSSSTEKIDPVVSLIMAIGRITSAEKAGASVYEERGLLTFG